ncbi:MAG: F0F1 ATP synthase subunit epsilon [Candidatus Poribacteria bacterium]|nr:F0F1 ATP synthase subunit epsilon [Candidatus Poribacteria bacterium]
MLDRSFHLEIRTPEQLIYEGDVTSVHAPGVEGNFQILPGHIPFLTALEVGEIRIRESSDTPQLMATSGGVFEVLRTGVTALVETAEWASEIDVERAESALERAQAQLAANAPDLNRPRAEAALTRAQNRIKVASNL